jgi:hypothetical protein
MNELIEAVVFFLAGFGTVVSLYVLAAIVSLVLGYFSE